MNSDILSITLVLFVVIVFRVTKTVDEKRFDEITECGMHIKPFNLEKTHHAAL